MSMRIQNKMSADTKKMSDLSQWGTAVIHDMELSYPEFPYDPPEKYPELKIHRLDPGNGVYARVRELLLNLGLDKDRYGSKVWNPLGQLIQPGRTVVIKPNWVIDYNPLGDNTDSLITHTSVIRILLDYICLALEYRGKVVIADAPLQSCNFDRLLKLNNAADLVKMYSEKYKNIDFSIVDLRKTVLKSGRTKKHLKSNQEDRAGDPLGYSLVDISADSLLMDLIDRYERFRVTCYDHRLLIGHHNPQKNEYLVANSILEADTIINIGKMKCHKKTGLTGAMKNLVGINGHKEYLPHHIRGSVAQGGDQYIFPSIFKTFYNRMYDYYWSSNNSGSHLKNRLMGGLVTAIGRLAKLLARDGNLEGSWYGNETIPRTIVDLNNIAYFFNRENGRLVSNFQRHSLHIIDGIVAGEGNGPVTPSAKAAGILIAGFNPALVDQAMAGLMGYDPRKIKTLVYALSHDKSSLRFDPNTKDCDAVSFNDNRLCVDELPNLDFIKPKYWTQMEYDFRNNIGKSGVLRKQIRKAFFKNRRPIIEMYERYRANQSQPTNELTKRQLERLNTLLNHAHKNVPYYHDLLKDSPLRKTDNIVLHSIKDMERIPFLTKEIIRREKERIYSRDHKALKSYRNSSGGSTGEPVVILQDRDYLISEGATFLLPKSWKGVEPYDSEIVIWGAERDTFEGKKPPVERIKDFLRNRITLNSFKMTPADIENYIEILNNHQPKMIRAYADSIYEIAAYARRNDLKVRPQNAIHTAACSLHDLMRAEIEEVFQCPVFNHYGCREVGSIASECKAHDGLHILMEHNLVEVVDRDGNPCDPGQEGEIVVTNLDNFSMPVIRYRIGDIGVMKADTDCPCGCNYPKLDRVTGRVTDAFKTADGGVISPIYFAHLLGVVHEGNGIKKFQIVQKDYRRVVIKIVRDEEINPSACEDIRNKVGLVMGADCEVELDYVSDLEFTKTGKFRFTVSEVS